jgi:formate dehydrogenase (coenzyme F420) beta subunit
VTHLEELKSKILSELPKLDLVLGWEQGHDALHATPLFISRPEDVDRLITGPLCVHNLSGHLPYMKDKKVGIIVKGCDSRAVIQLLQEKLIDRDNITVFGLTCSGVIDIVKVRRRFGKLGQVGSARVEGNTLLVKIRDTGYSVPFSEVTLNKCENCRFPNALIFDHFIGSPELRDYSVKPVISSLDEFEKFSMEQRFAFWKREMSRCIRCYACRSACPMCVCRSHCIATSRDPHWLSQENSPAENWMFQMIHVMHLSGRCISCGECERACPMGIPLMFLRQKMNNEVKAVFNYEAGIDPQASPPLMTFKVEEDNIPEREW